MVQSYGAGMSDQPYMRGHMKKVQISQWKSNRMVQAMAGRELMMSFPTTFKISLWKCWKKVDSNHSVHTRT